MLHPSKKITLRIYTRTTSRDGQSVTDSFGYNNRSELTTATVNNGSYAYEYDNIGNRKTSQEVTEEVTGYTANELNQYTSISVDGDIDFQPEYDADGNQTRVKTSTGIWAVIYNAENRPSDFYKIDESGSTTVKCTYDHMGRRATRLVTVNGNVTLHQRYIYRGYLQIACIDLTRSHHPALWYILWDPTQPVATRPLAIQLNGTWYTYGWDLTKNICELYGQHGYIRTAYTYTPYGQVTATGDTEQPIQWSSEFNDTELGLIYYNYRHYNPVDGRWIGRDTLEDTNLLVFVANNPIDYMDILGQRPNINLLPDKKVTTDGKTEYMLAENCINMSSSFVIVAHGNPHYIIDKNGAELYPGDLTNLMISKGYKFDKPVLLIACETGLGFAQKLANELKKRGEKSKCLKDNVVVYAPFYKTSISFDEKGKKIKLYHEQMHISVIGTEYHYFNGVKVVMPKTGVTYRYDLEATLHPFTPQNK